MVATTHVDTLDLVAHTLCMNDVRPQLRAEMPQQELRFTAHDPVLDEALASLEKNGQKKNSSVPEHLFLYAIKRIAIDRSDTFDGVSQNYSTYTQYRKKVEDVSSRGTKKLRLDSWMKPLYAGPDRSQLIGVGMRVIVESHNVEKLIAPPLYGAKNYLPPLSPSQIEEKETADKLLGVARNSAFIPVRYEIRNPADNPSESLDRLHEVLSIGAYVAHMTIVSPSPRHARENPIFHDNPFERTFTRVDQYLSMNQKSSLTPPINISSNDPDAPLENVS